MMISIALGKKALIILAPSVLIALIGIVMIVSVIIIPLASFSGSPDNGSGSGSCATASACPSPNGNAISAWALAVANHLTMCGGDPQNHSPGFDKCYGTSGSTAMPTIVTDFLQHTYASDQAAWVSGNFQCVSLILAAYGLAGIPLPHTGDAHTFWDDYKGVANYARYPTANIAGTAQAMPDLPAMPALGDMMVWKHVDSNGIVDAGHIAVIVALSAPENGKNGSITVAQANAFTPILTLTLTPSLYVEPWSGGEAYTPLGYVRYLGAQHTPVAIGEAQFVCAALPYAKLAQVEMTEGADKLPHPWQLSVILAQWGVEQGWVLPSKLTGYNWGNSSAIPGFPSVQGTSVTGSPIGFAYGTTAEQGVAIWVTFAKMGYYRSIADAYPDATAQATALGVSKWDFSHYTHTGHDGDSLTSAMTTYLLARFDTNPNAPCS